MSTTPREITFKTGGEANAIVSKVRDYLPEQLAVETIRRRAVEAVIREADESIR
jgi:hypothetical protein